MISRVELAVHFNKQKRFTTVKLSEYGTPNVTLSDSVTIHLFCLYSIIFFSI